MNIEIIMDFFYEKISKRVKERIDSSKYNHSQIYSRDYKQLSWIINNKRTKNNRFLVTNAVLRNTDESGEAIGLVPKLNFKNEQEVLWGTKEEISNYLPDLFELLWNEVSKENSGYQIDKNLFLCDYVPYAKYNTYWNILFSENNNYPAITYGIFEDDVIENYDKAEREAYKFLYNKCKKDFLKIFNDFTDKTMSFYKIDKVFQQSFIENLFIPMLKNFEPDNDSLGLRVKNLIKSDLSHCASLIYENNTQNEYFSRLIRASSTYILSLEKIQKTMIFF